MTWLLSLLGIGAESIIGYLLTGLAALIGILITFFFGRVTGAGKEREKQQKARGDAYEQSLKDIGDAAAAGRGKLPDVASDPYNRDNSKR